MFPCAQKGTAMVRTSPVTTSAIIERDNSGFQSDCASNSSAQLASKAPSDNFLKQHQNRLFILDLSFKFTT